MGAGASSAAGVKASVAAATPDDLKATFSTLTTDEKQKMVDGLCKAPAPEKPVKVFGMAVSQNCLGPIMVAAECKCGGMELCNIMEGAQMKPEFLAMNPWHHVPSMEDGDVKIGESSAIMRYLAMKYMPELYPVADPAKTAMIDFAMDACACELYKYQALTVYIVFGFAKPAEGHDQAAANASYNEQLDCWLKHFVGDKDFAGGATPNLADYKMLPFIYAAAQPVVEKKIGLKLSEAATKYIGRFVAKVGAAKMLEDMGGYSIKEYAASLDK